MASPPHDTECLGTTTSTNNDDIILTLPNNITIRRYRTTDAASLAHHGNNKRIWDNLRNRMPHPYKQSDAETWIAIQNDPENWKNSGPWTPNTASTSTGSASSAGPLRPTNYTIAIANQACGSIGLDFGLESDIYARNAELGYWLSEEHWAKGVMGIVVPAFVDWSWKTFGRLVRLNAEVNSDNVGSRKVLEKAGFKVEGFRKWGFVKNGVLKDEVLLGMLRPGVVEEEREGC